LCDITSVNDISFYFVGVIGLNCVILQLLMNIFCTVKGLFV